MHPFASHATFDQIPVIQVTGDPFAEINQANAVLVQGDGNIIIFGMNNHYPREMPKKLQSRVAPEEFAYTVNRVNLFLRKRLDFAANLVLCGCSLFCCTAGLSLVPSIALHKHTKFRVRRILSDENDRLYNKLGLQWSLVKKRFGTIPTVEYCLKIEFLKRMKLDEPD